MKENHTPTKDAGPTVGDSKATSVPFKCGFVAVLGEPNVGKSTLVNRLTGTKLAAVTPKPQTTRDRILGVVTRPTGQIILVDTPGMHQSRRALNRYLVEQALKALADADLAVLMVEERDRPDEVTASMELLLRKLGNAKLDRILAINKIDLLKERSQLLPLIAKWTRRHTFRAVVPISCLKEDGLERLEAEILEALPEGPPLFPEEMYTDKTVRWLCQELIREKLTLALGHELPYALAVAVERFHERADQQDIMVDAVVYVERQSQKPIVLGRGGSMIKEVGRAARREMTRLTGKPVHLKLWVKVERNWTNSRRALRRLGYE